MADRLGSGLREGLQKRFGLTDGNSDRNRLSDESLLVKDEGRALRIGNMICEKCSGLLACLTAIRTNRVTPSPSDCWRRRPHGGGFEGIGARIHQDDLEALFALDQGETGPVGYPDIGGHGRESDGLDRFYVQAKRYAEGDTRWLRGHSRFLRQSRPL
jgi:hypothetical protein